jgi:hypothetical protein
LYGIVHEHDEVDRHRSEGRQQDGLRA